MSMTIKMNKKSAYHHIGYVDFLFALDYFVLIFRQLVYRCRNLS